MLLVRTMPCTVLYHTVPAWESAQIDLSYSGFPKIGAGAARCYFVMKLQPVLARRELCHRLGRSWASLRAGSAQPQVGGKGGWPLLVTLPCGTQKSATLAANAGQVLFRNRDRERTACQETGPVTVTRQGGNRWCWEEGRGASLAQ